jgi:hypothetical protein
MPLSERAGKQGREIPIGPKASNGPKHRMDALAGASGNGARRGAQ